MFRASLIAIGILVAHTAARAEDVKLKADFIGEGTYSPTTGCKKLEDIQNGKAAPNISTYPLKLTREGTGSWEGGCAFASIREVKSNVFESKMQCSEGAEEYEETVTFTRLDADRIKVASGDEALVYVRCKALKGTVER
ncbi:MAG TPA: hypothetical protein VIF13_07820 [Hyphomicrobium sp.]|jgi:hypothetical protein